MIYRVMTIWSKIEKIIGLVANYSTVRTFVYIAIVFNRLFNALVDERSV